MQEWTQRKTESAKSLKSLSNAASPLEIAATMGAAIDSERSSALDLGSGMRERLESHFGPMVSRVKFVESDLPASFGAKAIAQGDTVRVAPGAYAPGTESGERMLSHELGHIVQQSRGEGMGGIAGMPMLDASVERGADAIAESAMAGESPVMTSAPAASAPMLGLGFLDIVRGWWNRLFMSEEEIGEVQRMVANRAWKVSSGKFQENKFNPTKDEKLQKWQDDIDYAFNSGASDQEKSLKMLYYFTKSEHSPLKGREIQIDSELRKSDPNGLRERLLNMARGINNNPAVADSIDSFKVMDPESDAQMSVNTDAAKIGKSPIFINPFQTAKEEDVRYTPAPTAAAPAPTAAAPAPAATNAPAGQNAAGNGVAQEAAGARAELDDDFKRKYGDKITSLTAEEEEEKRQKTNQYWYYSKLGQLSHHVVSDGTYAGNHELGHLASLLLSRRRNGNNGEQSLTDFHEATTENEILQSSITHLWNREGRNKYEYNSPKKYGKSGIRSIRTYLSKWLAGFGKNEAPKNKKFFVAKDKVTGEPVTVLKKYRNEVATAAKAQMDLDPDTARYKAEEAQLEAARAAAKAAAPAAPAGAPGDANAPAAPAPAPAPAEPEVDYDRSGHRVNKSDVAKAVPFDPNKHKETRSYAEYNLDTLFGIGETSAYGTVSPAETIAEAFADVDSHGKAASRINKQAYKRMWRELNPDAAYEEYLQKKEKKKSKDPENRYYKWAHRNDRK